jgi:hypothetical protein
VDLKFKVTKVNSFFLIAYCILQETGIDPLPKLELLQFEPGPAIDLEVCIHSVDFKTIELE